MNKPDILYDGWSLVYRPDSPSALHLQALLALHPPDVQARVALPGELAFALPAGVEIHLHPAGSTERDRLVWEQRSLPRMARRLGAGLLHLTALNSALFGRTPAVISPAGFGSATSAREAGQVDGLATRLRRAAGQGGLSRLKAVFWPADLPDPQLPGKLVRLPPVVHPAFWRVGSAVDDPLQPAKAQSDLSSIPGGNGRRRKMESRLAGNLLGEDLPETYLLYHGPYSEEQLRLVLEAWSWAAGAIGDYYPLLLVGLTPGAKDRLASLVHEYRLDDFVRSLPALAVDELAKLYHGCAALFHPAEISPWGGPVRLALACGKPVVAVETPLADALVGPAAYLVPANGSRENNRRALGAALITVVVEESVAESLSLAARQRAAAWQMAGFAERLLQAYLSLSA